MTVRNRATVALTVVCLALVPPALILSADGCAKKESEAPANTAQQRPQADEPAAAAVVGKNVAPTVGDGSIVVAGNRVTAHYRGTLSDGSVFDQSKPERPIVFVAGSGQLIPGFDKAVIGMKVNEEKTITIPASEAYGPKNPNMIRNVPRADFEDGFAPEVGGQVTIRNTAGLTLLGKVVSMSADSLLIDFNHVLAGKDLTFDIKVVAIQ